MTYLRMDFDKVEQHQRKPKRKHGAAVQVTTKGYNTKRTILEAASEPVLAYVSMEHVQSALKEAIKDVWQPRAEAASGRTQIKQCSLCILFNAEHVPGKCDQSCPVALVDNGRSCIEPQSPFRRWLYADVGEESQEAAKFMVAVLRKAHARFFGHRKA